MTRPVMPVSQITLHSRSQIGCVKEFGHCFTERPAEQWGNPDYTFENLAVEYNTNSLMTQPKVLIVEDNTSRWTPHGDQWALAYPAGYHSGRTLYKWTKADPSTEYSLGGNAFYYQGEPVIWEVGFLPTPSTDVPPEVNLYWGSETARLKLQKDRSPIFSVKDGSYWKEICEVPLDFKFLWKDVGTELIYIVSLFDGLLFSTDGTDWLFVRPPGGVEVGGGYLRVVGTGGVAVFGCHEAVLEKATLESGVIETGSPATTEAVLRVQGQLAGGSYTAEKIEIDSSSYRYSVVLTPGKKVMAITKVSVDHPPDIVDGVATETPIYDVETLDEQIPEDPTEETCTLRLLNRNYQYTGVFKRFDTASWYLGWGYSDASYTLALRNTGIVHTVKEVRNDKGERYVELNLKSPIQRVKDSTVIFAPDYSGWLVEDALEDSLLRCGIPLSKQSIYAWGITLPDNPEKGAWQPEFGTPWWKWFEEIVYYILGGWIVTQRDGTVRIEPYPEVEDQTWEGVFQVTQSMLEEANFNQPDQEISEIRNIVVVQGLTPEGYPLAAVLRDEGSLYDPYALNYVGYPKPLVVRSASLSTQEIVNYTCGVLYERFRKLRNTIEFTTNVKGGSPDLYPGALIEIVGIAWMIVRAVSTSLKHGELKQTVYGHYIGV